MGRRKRGAVPDYKQHKASGMAYCHLDGRQTYLGKYGTPESYAEYRRLVRECERAGKEEARGRRRPGLPRPGLTVAGLCDAWLNGEARRRYALPDGTPTSEHQGYTSDLAAVMARHGARAAEDFGRDELRDLRDHWQASGVTRGTVNKRLSRVKRLFRWACGEGLVGGDTLAAVLAVRGLREGEAPDRERVPAVPRRRVNAVLPFLPRPLRACALLQQLVGMRPGEAVALRGRELHADGVARLGDRRVKVGPGLWVFQPGRHKARKRAPHLAYLVGPKAQRVLRPWLPADPDAFLFPSPRGGRYGENYYAAAVRRACDRAGVPRFAPNQIRHEFLTRMDEEMGIQRAGEMVGHSSPNVTLLYVERRLRDAAEAVRRLG